MEKLNAAELHQLNTALQQLVETITARRRTQGLTQQDVAARMRVTQSTVSDLETRITKNPTLGTLIRYAAACGLQLRLVVTPPPEAAVEHTHHPPVLSNPFGDDL